MKQNLSTLSIFMAERLTLLSKALTCSLFFLFYLQVNSEAQTANIFVTPSSSSISNGQSFTVNVRVDITSGSINAAQISFDFNPARLQVTNITRPNSAQFSSEAVPLPATYTTINSTGQVNYTAGMPSGSTSTDFDILAITFTHATPLIAGTTPLTLVNAAPRRTRAVLGFTPAPGTLTSGSATLTNNCGSGPSATLSAASGASTCNGQPVPLTLSAATGVGPFTLEINGTTYTNVAEGSSFTNIPFPTYSIWPSNPTPAVPNNNDGQAVEVGVKFRSSQAGFIKGIRFYNGSSNSGTYTGKLWNYSSGTMMASAVFSSVSQNGWQQVFFSSPVPIAPNTTYIASYHSTAGNYAVTDNYFNSAVTNGPLTALVNNGVSGVNGVYRYGSGVTMPGMAYASSNYWVDVVYVSNTNTINLTRVVDANGCEVTGALQTINSFSANCSSLPVTLMNLSATPGNRKVTLRWATSSEQNNRGFNVERSTDGTSWTTVGFVEGAGNSNFTKNYTYTDNNLEPRKYFYRLKQIDIDENFKYSAIVAATLGTKAEFVLGQSYPNPTKGQATVQFTLPQAETVNISLFDVSGRMMKVLVNGNKEAGTHAINFNVGMLTKGVYYYKMTAGDFTDVKKLTIQ